MKIKNLSLAVFITFFYGQASQAGSATSGGGGTHTCLNPDGSVLSSELYDLYEGREARGYNLVNPAGKTANQLLNEAMKKIYESSPLLAYKVKEYLDYYVGHKTIKENKQLAVINDANILFLDIGCQYQQIAKWQKEYDRIFIDGNLNKVFAKSPLNVAALALHEAVYAYERQQHSETTDSDYSRKLVAEAYSDAEFELKDDPKKLYEKIPINIGKEYSIRFTRIKNGSQIASIGLNGGITFGCDLIVSSTCTWPLSLPRNIYLDLLFDRAHDNKSLIRVEILANGIPINSRDVRVDQQFFNDGFYQKDLKIMLLVPYEEALEDQILNLAL